MDIQSEHIWLKHERFFQLFLNHFHIRSEFLKLFSGWSSFEIEIQLVTFLILRNCRNFKSFGNLHIFDTEIASKLMNPFSFHTNHTSNFIVDIKNLHLLIWKESHVHSTLHLISQFLLCCQFSDNWYILFSADMKFLFSNLRRFYEFTHVSCTTKLINQIATSFDNLFLFLSKSSSIFQVNSMQIRIKLISLRRGTLNELRSQTR